MTSLCGGLMAMRWLTGRFSKSSVPFCVPFCANAFSAGLMKLKILFRNACLLCTTNATLTRKNQSLTAWVHAIARYKMIDLLRAKSIRDDLHELLDDDLAVFAESATDASDVKRDLNGLLATLPERQRLPIQHVKSEGLSVFEIAKLTSMSEAAVKIGIHRGLKALATRLRTTP